MRNNIFARFARWILSWADPEEKPIAGPAVYAIVYSGERVAEVSTNQHRIRAEALTSVRRGKMCFVLEYQPVRRWFPGATAGIAGTEIDP